MTNFYKQIYGRIVRDYNEEYAKDLGYQNELSLSVGADYYKYTPKNWFHFWATAYPVTKGMLCFWRSFVRSDKFLITKSSFTFALL